ncbi:MAG: uncharacterized protein QOF39_3597 [Frankiales bacterium]|nr:uncharacterized protein [Frankiales bacterium]
MSREVGRVAALWRYPVKSMAEESLESADATWNGLTGDRRWAFIRPGRPASNFPWLTIRELPTMNQYRPATVDPARPEGSQTLVRTPSGDLFDVADPALARELGDGISVIRQNRGVFDWMPLSLLSTGSVASLEDLLGSGLDPLRFRPNILVEAIGDGYPEDAWIGRTLRIGGMAMRGDERDGRCVVVNVDPATSARDPAVMRTIARERQACLGLYGSTVQEGRLSVGDVVYLED